MKRLKSLVRRARRSLLTASDELCLLSAAKAGDLDARNRLVEANIGLLFTAKTSLREGISKNYYHLEDDVGEYTPILIRCIEQFDLSRGFRFSTFAVVSLRRAMQRNWEIEKRKRLPIDPEAEVDKCVSFDNLQLADSEELEFVMRPLSVRERHILLLRFAGELCRDIGRSFNISKERVRQIERKALSKAIEIAKSLKVA